MDNLKLQVERAAAFSLTATLDEERALAARLRCEAREEIEATLFNLGGLIAILSQFDAQDGRVLLFKETQKLKKLA